MVTLTATPFHGLSPPTRGNPPDSLEIGHARGSIPAHAGEPHAVGDLGERALVYPRPRGGTSGSPSQTIVWGGLSPPTRGNRGSASHPIAPSRSIPAHAGEPDLGWILQCPHAVYPRPRGGTNPPVSLVVRAPGLSPPTRGNRRRPRDIREHAGSIPAHAGEPGRTARGVLRAKVYPRPRGGTRRNGRRSYCHTGLSPPTRGNRPREMPRHRRFRSIPAHAGEPPPPQFLFRNPRVYPRPRGGTKKE